MIHHRTVSTAQGGEEFFQCGDHLSRRDFSHLETSPIAAGSNNPLVGVELQFVKRELLFHHRKWIDLLLTDCAKNRVGSFVLFVEPSEVGIELLDSVDRFLEFSGDFNHSDSFPSFPGKRPLAAG